MSSAHTHVCMCVCSRVCVCVCIGSEEEEQMANMLARVAVRKCKVEDADDELIADDDWAVITAEAK